MKALLLAAGLGTRLLPLTLNTPKCLIPVGGQPLIDYWLNTLSSCGIKNILVNIHYHAELVRDHIEKSPYSTYVDIVYEENLLGTAGTLRNNLDYFEDNRVILIHADNLCICNFNEFIDAHRTRPKSAVMTMMTFQSDDPENCGIVKLNKTEIVTEFYEKSNNPPGNIANAAVYILESEVIDFIKQKKGPFIDFSTEIIPQFINHIFTWQNNEILVDIGTPDNLAKANKLIKS